MVSTAFMKNSQIDGVTYGIPKDLPVLYYNKMLSSWTDPDRPPQNWDEQLELPKAYKKGSDGNIERYGIRIQQKVFHLG